MLIQGDIEYGDGAAVFIAKDACEQMFDIMGIMT